MNKSLIYIIAAGIIVILFGSSAYLFSQNQKLIEKQSSTQNTPSPRMSIIPTFEPTATSSASKKSDEPVIILPPQDASVLKKRIVDPYIEYFKDTHKNDDLVSFNILLNTGAGQDQYPYKAQTLTENGISEGFLISKTNGQIDWWYPDCLIKCEFTDEFKTKYPEIVAKVE